MLFPRAAMVDDTYGIMQVCMHMLAWQPSLFSIAICLLSSSHHTKQWPAMDPVGLFHMS